MRQSEEGVGVSREEQPRQRSIYICLGQSEKSVCVCVDRTPGIFERILLTAFTPLLDSRHVADRPSVVRLCLSECGHSPHPRCVTPHRFSRQTHFTEAGCPVAAPQVVPQP